MQAGCELFHPPCISDALGFAQRLNADLRGGTLAGWVGCCKLRQARHWSWTPQWQHKVQALALLVVSATGAV